MTARVRTLLLLVLLALVPAACSHAVRQPEVKLDGVRIGGIGLRGGTIYALVNVNNPNSFDLEARSLTYDLQVAHPDSAGRWISFSQGTLEDPIRIRSGRSTVIEVPVQFRYDDFGGAWRSVMDTGTLNYRVRGDVQLSEPIGRRFPYAHSGVVSLSGVRD